MNVYPDGQAPAFSCWRRCPQADVEGTPCGIAVVKKILGLKIPCFHYFFLPTPALVIGVPSTFPRCGGDLLQQEKAFLACIRGNTNSPGFFHSVSLYRPHPPLRRSPFPGGEGYRLPSGGIRSTVMLSSDSFRAVAPYCKIAIAPYKSFSSSSGSWERASIS